MGGTVWFRHDPLHAANFSTPVFPCNKEAQVAAARQTRTHKAQFAPPIAGKADA